MARLFGLALGLASLAPLAVGCVSGVANRQDAGTLPPGSDAGNSDQDAGRPDAGVTPDAGSRSDGGSQLDGGGRPDAGSGPDGGSGTISWNGSSSYLYGINYPWLNIGVDFGSGPWGDMANPTQVQSDMATFASEGGHFLRWWLWYDARYDPLFDSDGGCTGFDPQFFSDLDTQLQYVANNNIYLDLTFSTPPSWTPPRTSTASRRADMPPS